MYSNFFSIKFLLQKIGENYFLLKADLCQNMTINMYVPTSGMTWFSLLLKPLVRNAKETLSNRSVSRTLPIYPALCKHFWPNPALILNRYHTGNFSQSRKQNFICTFLRKYAVNCATV